MLRREEFLVDFWGGGGRWREGLREEVAGGRGAVGDEGEDLGNEPLLYAGVLLFYVYGGGDPLVGGF